LDSLYHRLTWRLQKALDRLGPKGRHQEAFLLGLPLLRLPLLAAFIPQLHLKDFFFGYMGH